MSLPPMLSAASSSPTPTPSPPLSSAASSPPPSPPTPPPAPSHSPSPQLMPLPPTSPSTHDPHPPCRDRAIDRCIAFAIPAVLGLVMVVFLVIPAGMPPEFNMGLESSLSTINVNVSASQVTTRWNLAFAVRNPSPIIAVHYTHVELILRYDNRLTLSHTSMPTFIQTARNRTTVRATVRSTLTILNDISVDSLVNSLNGGQAVSIDVAVKAKRRLHLGPLNWVVFDVYAWCSDVTFTRPTEDSRGSARDWMLLGGTPSCNIDIFSQI